MIRLGDYNDLKVVRSTSVGVFLEDGEQTEILLPNKYVPNEIEKGMVLKVFCYLDSSERPVATTLTPLIIRDQFAYLKVADVGPYGAFMDWGLEKHLLVPFREQAQRMQPGQKYVVHCHLDEKTFRLVGSSKVDKFLGQPPQELAIGDVVDGLVGRKTPLGWELILNHEFKGLLFESDVFRSLHIGDTVKAHIKNIRSDGKLDISLQPSGAKMLLPTAETILERLKAANGFLPLHDKSSPALIQQELQLSKKAFKKAIGVLYRQKKITIHDDGIRLV